MSQNQTSSTSMWRWDRNLVSRTNFIVDHCCNPLDIRSIAAGKHCFIGTECSEAEIEWPPDPAATWDCTGGTCPQLRHTLHFLSTALRIHNNSSVIISSTHSKIIARFRDAARVRCSDEERTGHATEGATTWRLMLARQRGQAGPMGGQTDRRKRYTFRGRLVQARNNHPK